MLVLVHTQIVDVVTCIFVLDVESDPKDDWSVSDSKTFLL